MASSTTSHPLRSTPPNAISATCPMIAPLCSNSQKSCTMTPATANNGRTDRSYTTACSHTAYRPARANTIRSDILEFLDSPDIREHLDGIGYEPTTPEAAFIVDRSSEKTLHQKIEAWQKILENMPNCAMNRRYGTFNTPQLPCLSSRRHQMGAQENRPVQTTWQAHVFL